MCHPTNHSNNPSTDVSADFPPLDLGYGRVHAWRHFAGRWWLAETDGALLYTPLRVESIFRKSPGEATGVAVTILDERGAEVGVSIPFSRLVGGEAPSWRLGLHKAGFRATPLGWKMAEFALMIASPAAAADA